MDDLQARRQRLRHDVRMLGRLELATQVIGLGALIGIAVHAILANRDASMMLSFVLLLAVVYLVAALRVRAGAAQVSRDLWRLEGTAERQPVMGHPYRELPTLPTPSSYTRGIRFANTIATAVLASGLTLAWVAISR